MESHFNDIDIIPGNEAERLEALKYYRLVQHLPEGYFTNLAHIVARTFQTPIALISIVYEDHVEFPGNVGMTDTKKVPRGLSLCSLAILHDHPTVFENALEEPCLLSNPLITGNFGLRFYAGAPILTKNKIPLGTVCIVDKQPRSFSEKDTELLEYFAAIAMSEIEKRYEILKDALAYPV